MHEMQDFTIQQHRPANDPADFVANRVELPGAREVYFDAEKDQMQVSAERWDHEVVAKPDFWVEATDERDKLLTCLEEFQSKQKIEISGKKVNVRECSWPEVLELITHAEHRYKNEKVTGVFGQFRKCLRKLGKNGATFENWLRILPDGDYGSIISGSFHVILQTASEMSNVRECVLDALADIPDIIAHAEVYIEIYRCHPARRLNQATAALFKGILVSLRLILEYFGRKSLVKAIKTFTQGSAYEATLTESIQDIRTLAKSVKEEASQCLQERLCSVDQTVLRVDQNVVSIDKKLLSLIQVANTLPQALYRLLQSNPLVDRRTGKVGSLTAELGTEESSGGKHLRALECSQPETPLKAMNTSGIKDRKVLKIMRYDQISPVLDIERCLELADELDPTSIDRASWVMSASEFQSWLNEAKSSRAILVNGNSDPMANTSPLSLFCAHITHLFVAAKSVIVVSYFCGLHVDPMADARSNAQGMMISLIGQLLLQARQKHVQFDLSFLVQEKLQLLAEDDLKTLCKVFRNLVIQVPKDIVIFCVIDGISLYESTDGLTDLLHVWQRLNQLLAHKKLKAVMKLLATSPGQTLYLHDENLMMDGDVLLMPEEVDGDRQKVWNTADIDESINESFSSEKK